MADEKFSELTPIDTLALDDIFAVSDTSDPSSATKSKGAPTQKIVDTLNSSALLDTGSLKDQGVTLAKQADIPTKTILGRNTAGIGTPEAIAPANITVAPADKVFIQDASDSDKWSTATAQSIADLAATASVIGKHTIWIPARDIRPAEINGCAALVTVATTSTRPDSSFLAFDANSDEFAQFYLPLPKSWNLGTVTFQVIWENTENSNNGVAWALEAVAVHNTERLGDTDYGVAVVVVDNGTTNTTETLISSESSAMTIANTPIDGDFLCFQIFRDVSDPGDTITVDTRLFGLRIFFTTDAANDN